MNIFINVDKQKLRCCNNLRKFTSGTRSFIWFNFILSDDWKDLVVFAQFVQNGKKYNKYLDEEYKADLPAELVSGSCTLALCGTKNGVIAKSNKMEFDILKDPIEDGEETMAITLTLYEQLVNKVDSLTSDDGVIKNIVSEKLQGYVESGELGDMVIGDDSIGIEKISSDSIATLSETRTYLGI